MSASKALHDGSIRELVSPWAVRYRREMLILVACGLAGGLSVFFENAALESLSRAIAAEAGKHVDRVVSSSGPLSMVTGAGRRALTGQPPLVILVVMLGGRLLRMAVAAVGYIVGGRLKNRTRDDIESRVLADLFRKDPGFFTSRPPGEILNRLGEDVNRVAQQRLANTQRFEALFLIAGNLLFFVDADARMAGLAILTCVVGVYFMNRTQKGGAEYDKLAVDADDVVKARFEGVLGMTQEIQISDLSASVRADFESLQARRRRLLDASVGRQSRVPIVSTSAYVLSLGSLVVVALYFLTAPNPDARAALVPVMLRALPDLFMMATQLIQQNDVMQRGRTSARRLLEYGEPGSARVPGPRSIPPRSARPIEVKEATFRYSNPDGGSGGGVREITTTFTPGKSTAIVGAAGSGKSTLLQLLLGQRTPQSGSAAVGDAEIGSLRPEERAATMSLMPQTVVLFDGSIIQNLYFGSEAPDFPSDDDQQVLDDLGILEMCRIRALDAEAGGAAMKSSTLEGAREKVVEVRARITARLKEAGIDAVAASKEIPASYWVAEHILRGRAQRAKVLPALRTKQADVALAAVAEERSGATLISWARALIDGTKNWLMQDSYAVSAKLAPFPIDVHVWELRRSATRDVDLLRVALTASFAELQATCGLGPEARSVTTDDPALAQALAAALREVVVPLEDGMVHPLLSWRDNLVFASMTLSNRRQEALVDRIVIEESLAAGLGRVLEQCGLSGMVGRGGSRLSGGQRQLVALARTVLRRTPVVVLDEPTSALDPANRARVSRLLDDWKRERIVIVVTHDPELARACDEVRVLERGQLVASGPFADVAPGVNVFAPRAMA